MDSPECVKSAMSTVTNNSSRQAILTFDTSVYRLNAIKKAAYKFGGRCIVNITLTGECEASLVVECSNPLIDLQDLIREIHCEVADQELREVVLAETVGVRNLLLAQAFSATSLIEPEESSVDYQDDPLRICESDVERIR